MAIIKPTPTHAQPTIDALRDMSEPTRRDLNRGARRAPMTYEASPIKRRRSTKAEVDRRREALLRIVDAMKPMTVRQVYYQATVRGIVDKTEAG
jgi:hypothetical protein